MTISLKADAGGNSGAIQVDGVSVMSFGPGLSLSNRNKIINGAFGINQRGYVSGAATTAGQYTVDRWKVAGTQGITFATVNNKTTVTIPSGQTLQQVIEGLNLQSGTYVLSWEGTAQGRIAGGAYSTSGGVTASITGGTNTTIEFNAGTVSNVQLEIGTVATPFEHRSYGVELVMCQRYLEIGFYRLEGYGTPGGVLGAMIMYKATKRSTPSITFAGTGYANASGISFAGSDASGFEPRFIVTASGGAAMDTHWQSSAEL